MFPFVYWSSCVCCDPLSSIVEFAVSRNCVLEMVLVRNGLSLLPGTLFVTNCSQVLSLAFYFFVKLVVFPG